MDEDKENILLESIKEKVRKVKENPAKVLLLPPLCAGYIIFFSALYANVIMYHVRRRDK